MGQRCARTLSHRALKLLESVRWRQADKCHIVHRGAAGSQNSKISSNFLKLLGNPMVALFSGVSCDQHPMCELSQEKARKHPLTRAVPTEASVQSEVAASIPSPPGTPARA